MAEEEGPGFISPTCLLATFLCVDPKSAKIQSSSLYPFALLGSAQVKAAGKMLMKLTPETKGYSK